MALKVLAKILAMLPHGDGLTLEGKILHPTGFPELPIFVKGRKYPTIEIHFNPSAVLHASDLDRLQHVTTTLNMALKVLATKNSPFDATKGAPTTVYSYHIMSKVPGETKKEFLGDLLDMLALLFSANHQL